MEKIKTRIRLLSLLAIIQVMQLQTNCFANENEVQNREGAITFSAGYIGDLFNNFHGGIQTGHGYMGLINFGVSFEFEQAGLWTGGEIYAEFQNTHGGLLSGNYLGDLQVVSNIENGDYSYLFQLWYRQRLGNLTFTIGRHDLNADFFVSDLAAEYINSSFGIMGIAPINMPVSIFPKTGLGAIVRYDLSRKVSVSSAIYDGDPLDLERDRYGLDFRVGAEESFLGITEVEIRNDREDYPGIYKAGFVHHNGDFLNMEDTTSTLRGNSILYVLADQMLYRENAQDNQGLSLLAQYGISPENRSVNNMYLALGLNYYGLLPGRDEDVVGLAFAKASMSGAYRDLVPGSLSHETAIEFTYKYGVTPNITIQPDLQYILNPGASGSVNNAFVGIIRIQLEY